MANQRVYQILVYRHELFKINFTGVPSSSSPVSPRFFPLFRSLYFSLVLHYLNAWNRLEKTLAHSRSRDQTLQREWRFIQNGGYGEKSEKIWVRDMAKMKINKMVEKAEVQFKKKEWRKRRVLRVRVLGICQSVRGFGVSCFFF